MNARETIASAMRTEFPEDADAILAALKEAGYAVVPEFDLDLLDKALHEIEPRRGSQREPNQAFREFWAAVLLIARVERHLAAAQEQEEG